MRKGFIGLLTAVLGLGLCVAQAGAANGKWAKNHPRRAEVNGRLKNQNRRIRQGVKSGKLTKAQAQQLHKEDRAIRGEERADAAANGGHITKAEQHQINQQENGVSKQIYDEKH